jgi:DNA-binding beta-propeller fold protein YncE
MGDPAVDKLQTRLGLCALATMCAAALALAPAASGARTAYFTDPVAGEIAQFAVGARGVLTPLNPPSVKADRPLRLAMTPGGDDLYATVDDGILQFDVDAGGHLMRKSPALEPLPGPAPAGEGQKPEVPYAIAVHPDGDSAYVSDLHRGQVLQYDVGAGGQLVPKNPASVAAGPSPSGVAVRPDGRTAYALVRGGMAVFGVGEGGGLVRRPGRVDVVRFEPMDVALTPDGRHLYATSADGRVLQFDVGADGTPTLNAPASLDLGPGVKPVGLAVVPDGSAVYVATRAHSDEGDRRVFAFAVGPDGRLTPGVPPAATVATPKLSFLTATPDGKSLFVAGGDGYLFDIGPGPLLARKTPPTVDLKGALGVLVSPNQAPIATFTTPPATAGTATQFDASAAFDPDGSIVRYDWNFGDHTELPDGGPTPTHVYGTPGTYEATLVVTDNEGASTATVFTGGTMLGNGTPAAQARRAIVVAAPSAPAPVAPPSIIAPLQPLRPDLGETLLAEPLSGFIRVRLPGEERFQPLVDVEELPVGSTIDARRGRVQVTTVRDRRNQLQNGVFRAGVFTVRQRARDRFITELVLNGNFGPCPRAGQASAARVSRRRLWGNARGRFRSRGRYSSAAVRGTRWLVEDRCGGTLTRVRQGSVTVRDFVRDRRIVLRRGQTYLARPR